MFGSEMSSLPLSRLKVLAKVFRWCPTVVYLEHLTFDIEQFHFSYGKRDAKRKINKINLYDHKKLNKLLETFYA